jgi:predicted GNAT family acetyltransferase
MRMVRYEHAADFLRDAGAFLSAREAEHNLILGLSGQLERDPHAYGADDPYFGRVERGGETLVAALRTPPHRLLLAECDALEALELIVEDVADAFEDVGGVIGPPTVASRSADLWAARKGCGIRVGMEQRIYAAERVRELAPPAAGMMRRASEEDRALLTDWFEAFVLEALGGRHFRPTDAAVDDLLSRPGDEGAYVWVHGGPVCFAACGGPTPTGVRVGPVYTPPEARGRGYATALVAKLTQRLLAGGRRFCFLYTDASNPTSNRIYERIGYRFVTGAQEYEFNAPG